MKRDEIMEMAIATIAVLSTEPKVSSHWQRTGAREFIDDSRERVETSSLVNSTIAGADGLDSIAE